MFTKNSKYSEYWPENLFSPITNELIYKYSQTAKSSNSNIDYIDFDSIEIMRNSSARKCCNYRSNVRQLPAKWAKKFDTHAAGGPNGRQTVAKINDNITT